MKLLLFVLVVFVSGCVQPEEPLQGSSDSPSTKDSGSEPQPNAPADPAPPPPVEENANASAPAAPAEPQRVSVAGESTLTSVGPCGDIPTLGYGCAGYTSMQAGTFTVPNPARDVIVNVSWTPNTPTANELHVYVRIPDVDLYGTADGPSPLTIRIDVLEPGEYEVGFLLGPPGGAAVDQVVQWTASFTIAT